jgi:UDP-3-O-[3-hydroxymyristoyl] glucosamine N-acyltransferase
MPVSLAVLAAQLGAELHPAVAADALPPEICDVAGVDEAGPQEVTYIDREKHLAKLKTCRAGVVLVAADHVEKARESFAGPLLAVQDAKEAFIAAMVAFRPPAARPAIGISLRASVARTARIGAATNIHPLACVGERVVIGEHCEIHPGVVIGDDCVIADGVTIYPHAVLYAGTIVGRRVIIHATAVIGADGFGYRFQNGAYIKIPHTGSVVIEDDVEIGAGTTVDRAMVGETVIGAGTKIDNQVMVGHNCRIGRHNAFASQVGFAGSTVTDDYVRCAGQVGIADHLHIGKGATLGPKAGVHLDVPAGAKWHGFPAGPDKEQIRLHLSLQRVPELIKQVQVLSDRIAELEQQQGTPKLRAA